MLAHVFKNVEFELKTAFPGSEDTEFRAASPLGKIPGYKTDSGVTFPDSSVIIAYLERTSTSIRLYPENAEQYAQALWIEEYADTKMIEATAALYYQRIIGPKFFQHVTDEARVNEILDTLIPPVLDYIESLLTEKQWLIADSFSVADLAVGTNLVSLMHAGYVIDEKKWPKVSEFNTRFLALDAVKEQIALESTLLNG
jgi:glutathione S-transferase